MFSHIKSHSENDYSLFQKQKNLNSLPYQNLLTPTNSIKETFKHNNEKSNIKLKKNNNVIQHNQIKTSNKF